MSQSFFHCKAFDQNGAVGLWKATSKSVTERTLLQSEHSHQKGKTLLISCVIAVVLDLHGAS